MLKVMPRLRPTLGMRELVASWALLPEANENPVQRFEQAFARLAEQKYAVAFPYGRTGLICLLRALGLAGREVLVPAWTCVVVPHAIVHSGNEPVFVDCAPNHYNMDLHLAQGEIRPQTGAVIATSIFGHPVDTEALDALRAAHPDLPVIQDCAHSFFCTHTGRAVHKEGVAAIFGLNISKLLTSIFGGMVTTDDDALAERLRVERARTVRPAPCTKAWKRRCYLPAAALALWPPVYGMVNRLERSGLLNAFVRYYDEESIDMPADWDVALTAPEAYAGLVQCQKYMDIVARRRHNAAVCQSILRHVPGLRLPPWDEGATWSHYTVLAPHREPLLESALREGVQLGRLIEYNIPDMAAYRTRPGFRHCPHARHYATQSVNLPLWGDETLARRAARLVREHMAQ